MPANLRTEAVTLQHPLTRYASQAGWTIVPKEQATTLRRGEFGLFFYDLLKQKLQDLNPGVVTPELADDVIHRLESVRNNIAGNSEIPAWLPRSRMICEAVAGLATWTKPFTARFEGYMRGSSVAIAGQGQLGI